MRDIDLRVDDAETLALFRRLQAKVSDLTEPMDEVGALVHASVIRNFEVGGRYSTPGSWRGGPNAWQRLKLHTLFSRNSRFRKDRKGGGRFQLLPEKRRKLGILQVSGDLKNSFTWQPTATGVTIGTNRVQAAIQNFGGVTRPHVIRARRKKALAWPGGPGPVKKVNHPGSKIPARPMLVIQDEDITEIKAVLSRYLTDSP